MTTGKRALIVDDSRSARVILSRMLEQQGLAVDTAESAEQALDYLQRSRPDVIFMDHLMPGMDGFQAVQTIKADPLTATIPLMMYTSQEGELYVSQARALGAVGVLPKTVRPVDVSRILYQLHLLPDRRTQRQALFPGPAAAAAAAAESSPDGAAMAAALAAANPDDTQTVDALSTTATRQALAAAPLAPSPASMAFTPALASELQAGLRNSVQHLVKEQLNEQRRFLLATFEAFARRLISEMKESIGKIPPPPSFESLTPPPPRRQWWPVVLTALFAAVPAAVLGYVAWQANLSNASLARELADSRAAVERAKAAAMIAAAAASATVASNASPAGVPGGGGVGGPDAGPIATEYVPYGEAPLAGSRLERLRALASMLEAQQFKGRIRVESYVGDFCLGGNASEGFSPADASLPATKCDLVGNPFDDSLSMAQRQSVDFANFAATLRRRTGGDLQIEVVNGGRSQPVAYPEQDEKTTAGSWNMVAARNNRVEFHVLPAS
ncbi:MAG: response regulator [Gammaproteobacteria bacterium]|jgi:CheY-like chemotaxis protein|nr:response regulator [Gammaproteobacteria bacterium]